MNKKMTAARSASTKADDMEGRKPIENKGDPFYSAPNMEAIKRSANQLCQGKTVVKTIDELLALEDE